MTSKRDAHHNAGNEFHGTVNRRMHPFDAVVGPFLDAAGAVRQLGLPLQAVMDLAHRSDILGCPTDQGALVFPTFQFTIDGTVLPGLAAALQALASATSDTWQAALWMRTPTNELAGRTPCEALQQGDEREVLAVAKHAAARWKR
ncbi:hypothetical protein ACXPWS_29255 [Mycobacterium sp. BMJ-28]